MGIKFIFSGRMPIREAVLGQAAEIKAVFRSSAEGTPLLDMSDVFVSIWDPEQAPVLVSYLLLPSSQYTAGIWRYVHTFDESGLSAVYQVLFEGTSLSEGQVAVRADMSVVHVSSEEMNRILNSPTQIRTADTFYDNRDRSRRMQQDRPAEVGRMHKRRSSVRQTVDPNDYIDRFKK